MSFNEFMKKFCGICLVLAMVFAMAAPVAAEDVSFKEVDNSRVTASMLKEENAPVNAEIVTTYRSTDIVRVSIVLTAPSTIGQGFSTMGISDNKMAMMYNNSLETNQIIVTNRIEKAIGEKLDVVWNLTLVANVISANVEYGQIAAIEKVKGVDFVAIEQQYEPCVVRKEGDVDTNMFFAGDMTSTGQTWLNGYTGAGSRVAIIDTGTDTDHQSFSETAYLYALEQNAEQKGLDFQSYKDSLNLLGVQEISEKLTQLNVYERGVQDPSALYINSKLPFGYSYIDRDFDVTHDNDTQGGHGSHVAGIAAANRYVSGDDGMKDALSSVHVAGTAPDAQILTMKVFGNNGGAYESDYFAAIEDAIILDADTVNLSLGSSSPGFADAGAYQGVMENLKNSDTTVIIAAGNASDWAYYGTNSSYLENGHLYATEATTDTTGGPASYTNSLAVASVDNRGSITTGSLNVGDELVGFNGNNTSPQPIDPITSLDKSANGTGTEYPYVIVDSYGAEGDFDDIDVDGKIVLVSRGMSINFADKANRAVEAGAIATIIYNNVSGTLNMNLEGYRYTNPCVIITKKDAEKFRIHGVENTDSSGETYYTGTMNIISGLSKVENDNTYYTMSSFSSWGVPGDLTLKPELTAPGGNIYSVNGVGNATDSYVSMSGTSMATPHASGIGALVEEFISDRGYSGEFANPTRGLVQSLLMSTSVPLKDANGNYYPVIQQGSGLVDATAATTADSYIKMRSNATASYDDGKVKAELGDDPDRKGVYSFGFEIHNLDGKAHTYDLSAEVFAQDHFTAQSSEEGTYQTEYMAKSTVFLDADSAFTVGGENVTSVNVPANGSAKVDVVITLSDTAKQEYLDRYFEKGTYIQAFIFAKEHGTAEGVCGTTHSIPMLAFYGNWTDPSMFWGASSAGGQYLTNYRNNKTTDYSREEYFHLEYQVDVDVFKVYEPENTFTLNNGIFSYYLGGNPLIADDTYHPERNAVSNEVTLTSGWFSLARNYSQNTISVENKTTGELYYSSSSKSNDYGAFLNSTGSNYGAISVSPNFLFEDFVEGEQIEFSATYLPEYYDEGKMGENSVPGDGASASVTAVVDDTIPQASNISVDEETNTLMVTAADNEYVAAVVMYNAFGDTILSYSGAKQQIDPGESAVYELDMSEVSEKDILVQVFDYAMNMATYRVIIDDSSVDFSGAMLAYDREKSQWVVAGRYTNELPTVSFETLTYNAATSANGMLFAVTDEKKMYVLDPTDLDTNTYLMTLDQAVVDMAYNPADGFIYGVSSENEMLRINLDSGECSVIGSLPIKTNTLACSADGIFYSNHYGTGEIYSYTLDSVTTGISDALDFNADGDVNAADSQLLLDYVVGKTDVIANEKAADMDHDGDIDTYDVYLLQDAIPYKPELVAVAANTRSAYLQAMEVDPNNGHIYWASYFTDYMQEDKIGFSFVWEIIPDTKEIIRHYDVWDELTALSILDVESSSYIKPASKVKKLDISAKDKILKNGETLSLEAGVFPWNVENNNILWASSDESVAIVDENGFVTAVGNGKCKITATSVMDENVFVSCEITVDENGETAEKQPVSEWASVASVNNALKLDSEKETKTVVFDIPASKDLTNGMYTISIDTNKATLLSIGGADLIGYSQNKNLLTVGYVHEKAIATGEIAISLTFEVDECVSDCPVVINELQRNNEHLSDLMFKEIDLHSWGEWTETKSADCLVDGKEVRICGSCGESEERSIPAKGEHTWGEWKETKAADCLNNGEEERACEACGEKEQNPIPAKGEHTWGEWEVTKAADCLTDGEEERACEACGEKEQNPIPAKGEHTWSEWEVTKAADCLNNGEEERTCEACGEKEQNHILAKGEHTWGEWYTVTEATETADGEERRDCDYCDAYETNILPATGHICPSKDYTDLDVSQWYHEGVDFVLANGYMYGMGNGLFEPNGNLTRAQLVTILYRIEGSPSVTVENPFTDIPSGTWYTDAVIWASSEGVVYGVGNGKFAPDDKITREQIATILYRYSGASPDTEDHISGFSDASEISGYAVDAMNWAVGQGLIYGVGNNNLSPDTSATRSQIATILMRYLGA